MRPIRALRANIAGAALTVTFAVAAIVVPAMAEDWPTRPILVVSPYSPGNATDIVGRIVLDQVSQQLGQPFVIENRPGAGGVIGVASVTRADADGYTLLLSSSSMASAVILHSSLPYDPVRDLTAAAMFGAQPSVLITSPAKGYKSVGELVAAAKAKPGELNFASAGVGAASHIAGEKFRLAAGIKVQHVPYRGPNEAFTDVLGGRIDYYFLPIAPAIPMISQGKVTPLAVSTPKRVPLLPDVPSIVEAGYPDATYLFWGGISAPAKTPRAIINKLHDEVAKALANPGMQEKLQKLGVQPMPMTPEEFQKFFAEDVAAMVKLGKDADIKPTD
jgi:tripartite-type tricarboxylate transporter receptor subunit TctC